MSGMDGEHATNIKIKSHNEKRWSDVITKQKKQEISCKWFKQNLQITASAPVPFASAESDLLKLMLIQTCLQSP